MKRSAATKAATAKKERKITIALDAKAREWLAEKGYDLNYTWGIQKHGQKMLRTVFPEMMRWLWRDHGVSADPNDMVERSFQGAKK